MKKSIIFATMLLSMFFVSCSSDNEEREDVVPTVEFHFQFSSFIIHKGETLTITPTIVKEKSSPGLEIKKVGYYWDGKLIAVVETAPYALEYDVKDENPGSHNVIISLICGGDGYIEMKGTSSPYEVAILE